MRLSSKGRHAITAMLYLTMHKDKGPVTLAEISVNQNISLSYLEQLFACLRSKQLVRGVRGPGGGYYLGRAAEEISIADTICAVDEWVEFTHSEDRITSTESGVVTTQALWDDLSHDIYKFLSDITLHELVERARLEESARLEEKYIGNRQGREVSNLELPESEAA